MKNSINEKKPKNSVSKISLKTLQQDYKEIGLVVNETYSQVNLYIHKTEGTKIHVRKVTFEPEITEQETMQMQASFDECLL
jgi:hypothetical protein